MVERCELGPRARLVETAERDHHEPRIERQHLGPLAPHRVIAGLRAQVDAAGRRDEVGRPVPREKAGRKPLDHHHRHRVGPREPRAQCGDLGLEFGHNP